MELQFPVPHPVALDLAGTAGELDGAPGDDADGAVRAKEKLTGRISFGGPLPMPIDHTYHPEDTELQAYIKAKSGSLRFVLALMSISFPFGEPDLATADVQVELSDDRDSGQTLAYSLFPTELTNARDATRNWSLKPNLTFGSVSGSLGELDRGAVEHGSVPYLVGGPELSARPIWSFRRTDAQKIEKSARLSMIVQVPIGCTGSVSVSLQASIDKRALFAKQRIPLERASEQTPEVVTL